MRRLMVLFALLIALLGAGTVPLAAQAAAISVNATWVNPAQLTTLDPGSLPGTADDYPAYNAGDDYRYVDLRFDVTTNVEFWAVELVCNVNGNVLDDYVQDYGMTTAEDWGDNTAPIVWSALQSDQVWVHQVREGPPVAAGVLQVTAAGSQAGGSSRMVGRNGVTMTFQFGVMRFRVKPTAALPGGTATSSVTCTPAFLDRSGRPIVPYVLFTPPSVPLSITTGYSVSGKFTYQGRATMAGIGVACSVDVNGTPVPLTGVVTDVTGRFLLTNIRQMGWLGCTAFGNINTPAAGLQPDVYLPVDFGYVTWERGPNYTFLPTELMGGNLDRDNLCDPEQCIDFFDILKVTQNWMKPAPNGLLGDANGDGKTDRADLAMVASNLDKATYNYGNPQHILYSVPRAWNPNRDSRVWLGDQNSGAVTLQIPALYGTIDLWATLSPDGSTIAFIRKTMGATPAASKYELYRATTTGFITVTPILLKYQAGNMDAFAPQWSWDGTRIAFNCSTGYGATTPGLATYFSGYGSEGSAICVVDANGRNFQRLTDLNTAHIFPPAWDRNWIIYSGTPLNTRCPDTLCVYDISNGSHFRLDPDIPGEPGTNIVVDMPVIGGQYLFYRYADYNDLSPDQGHTLRVVDAFDLSCPGGFCDYVKPYIPHPTAACPGEPGHDEFDQRPLFAHFNVVYDNNPGPACSYVPLDANPTQAGAPYDLDYFEVAFTAHHLMFHGNGMAGFLNAYYDWSLSPEDSSPAGRCSDGDPNNGNSDKCYPEWQPGDQNNGFHYVDSMVGNWFHTTDYTPSLYWVERNAIDWVP